MITCEPEDDHPIPHHEEGDKDMGIEEIFTENCIRDYKSIHPTLKEVRRKLKGFDESLILYTYHKLNGREEEAETYLREWNDEQEILSDTLRKLNSNTIVEKPNE